MKTQIKNLSLCLVLIFAGILEGFSQHFQGIATYKTATSMRLNLDSSEVAQVNQEELQRQISKNLQREYTLVFNSYESLYKQVASLDGTPTAHAGNATVRVMGADNMIYRNTKDKSFKEKSDLFGKLFLIVDQPEELGWELTGERKQIGQYECQKATYTRISQQTEINTSKDEEAVTTTQEVVVEAWFTYEIPVGHGPDAYWGLPGLILEVNDGPMTVICTKVILNTKEEVTIEMPKAGKQVSSKEFEAIRDEKMQEMMEQYRGKDGGNRVIRIRG